MGELIMIKVLIADDNIIFAKALKELIEQEKNICVVDCVVNGEEALTASKKHLPDVVLMDIKMPICDGIQGTKLIMQSIPSTKVLVLTTFFEDDYISQALRNGAVGYILKDTKENELIMAIQSVYNGYSIIQEDVFNSLKQKINDRYVKNDSVLDIPLSDSQKKILQLIVEGKSSKEIAEDLHFAEGTIRNMISGILEIFNLKDRTQLAIFAIKNNII